MNASQPLVPIKAPRKVPRPLPQIAQCAAESPILRSNPIGRRAPSPFRAILRHRLLPFLLAPALIVLAGCAGGTVSGNPSNGTFSIAPGSSSIDTNCTGCNATSTQGASVEQFTATLSAGGAATVTWSVSGGDANSGAGTITSSGQYTPPGYLTADRVQVVVTAALESSATTTATAVLTVTPGFLQPLSPENAAVGANGQVTVTGYLAEAGGTTAINYALASSATGSAGGLGSLGSTSCQRSSTAFTSCAVTYSAPASITATSPTFLVATVGTSASTAAAELLLNTAGLSSSPSTHQAQLATPVSLGTSGGNNNDYDTSGNQIVDCCSGTLGSSRTPPTINTCSATTTSSRAVTRPPWAT